MPRAKSIDKPTLAHEILKALKTIDRPASFCCSGPCPLVLPGLNVPALGDIGLPLSTAEAKRLIRLCIQAPYGKGTETVVDTQVRKVWELDPKHFKLESAKWPLLMHAILQSVEEGLGLPRQSLAAHLYKLLVYEKGSFFLPHRDGEKLDGMVATLVINLPSKHTGGELVVHHDGQTVTLSMSQAAAGTDIEYAAFYADCQHEVKPLTSGYRLCLTYNLVLTKPRRGISASPVSYEDTTQELTKTLTGWHHSVKSRGELTNVPHKLAVLLEHRYSEDGLHIDQLKGVDRAQAESLFNAAEQAGCDAYLALVTQWESGQGDDGGRSYSDRYRYQRWHDDDDEAEDDDKTYTMLEVYDSSLNATDWSDRHGNPVDMGTVSFQESELVSKLPLSETQPSEQEFEGYTGNAGMTLERWYHRAAIVLWPRACRVQVWCEAGTAQAVNGLLQLLKEAASLSKSEQESQLALGLSFAREIVSTWDSSSEEHFNKFVQALKILNDVPLAQLIIEKALPKNESLRVCRDFLSWLKNQGWARFLDNFTILFTQTRDRSLARNAQILAQLATALNKDPARREICHEVLPLFLEAIESLDALKANSRQVSTNERIAIISNVVKSCIALENQPGLNRFLHWISTHPRYPLDDVQLSAIAQIRQLLARQAHSNRALRQWLEPIQAILQQRTAKPPAQPQDWRRAAQLSCSCADCHALAKFLADPNSEEGRFAVAEYRREHLKAVIYQDECDCTTRTLKQGSPHVLVCTKTNESYHKACQAYEANKQSLAMVSGILNT